MDAIILAGGLGTRIRELFPNTPKPLVKINNTPFLDILIKQLYSIKKISRVILALGHGSSCICNYYENNKSILPLLYSFEEYPYGTGGAFYNALDLVEGDHVLVLNGDSYLEFDLKALLDTHLSTKAHLTLAATKVDDSSRFGTILLNDQGQVLAFEEKQGLAIPGIINGGVYIFNRSIKGIYTFDKKVFSLENDLFPKITNAGKLYAINCTGTFIDIGTKSSYFEAQDKLRYLST
jgi:D-glycero-alpha-D-manno-heptose 1-phosphate guanylyltransferase